MEKEGFDDVTYLSSCSRIINAKAMWRCNQSGCTRGRALDIKALCDAQSVYSLSAYS